MHAHTYTQAHTHQGTHSHTQQQHHTHTATHTAAQPPPTHNTHTHTSDQHPPPGSAVGQRSCPPLRLSSRRASPRILAPKAPANRIPGTCTVHGGARHLRPGWLRRPAWPPAGHANDARLSPDCGRYLVPAAAAHTAGCVCRRAGRRYAPRAVRRTFWRTCHLLPRAIHAIWAVSSSSR